MERAAFFPDSCVVTDVVPSPNHGERKDGRQPDMILLHYTGMQDANAALERLTKSISEVSAHYLVFEDGRIVQMVKESRRAWHAGTSYWAGETDINSCSIGIEIANPGHEFDYPPFPSRQVAAVTALCRSIMSRFTIPAERVLAHSDVAPSRKQDPGEKFPWRALHDSGVGHWVKPTPISEEGTTLRPGDDGDAVAEMQSSLAKYGYGIKANGTYDSDTRDVVAAFQRHFRPQCVDGLADPSTLKTLQELLANRGHAPNIAARARAFQRLTAPLAPLTPLPRSPLTPVAQAPIPVLSVGRTAAAAMAERPPGRKVRAPWTNGAG
jgi:N-acetylmuramoyl-L-alanine amidase